ncbi:hypothetical protein C8R47DRAFT_169174 [Mycena vitilis]|nr:hypothetical protein C8R47DRAFT_169174 [Mycena vitilis]
MVFKVSTCTSFERKRLNPKLQETIQASSFPKDLQEHLAANIPPHLNIKIQTSLYPTYKSRKPIALATQNFLAWLATQPPGPVILLAHSMGGLLAADAATDSSNYGTPRSRRILGLVAFDVPYLGMHPHVVISGIASLFPDDNPDKTTAGDMNQHSDVQIVDDQVTDDWDGFKRDLDAKRSSRSRSHSPVPPQSPAPSPTPPPPEYSALAPPPPEPKPFGLPTSPLIDKTLSFITTHSNDPLVRWARKHSDEPFRAGMRFVVEYFQFGSCMFDPSGLKLRYARFVAWPGGLWVNYWTQTPARGPVQEDGGAEQRLEREEEVADNDVALLQMGMATATVGSPSASSDVEQRLERGSEKPDSDVALLQEGMANLSPVDSSSTSPSASPIASSSATSQPSVTPASDPKAVKKAEKERRALEKARDKEAKELEKARAKEMKRVEKQRAKAEKSAKGKPGHHFIVLPTGLGQILGGGDKWEKVVIEGCDDEVAAHCGLFIRGQNMDYEGLVERVGRRVLGWCETL